MKIKIKIPQKAKMILLVLFVLIVIVSGIYGLLFLKNRDVVAVVNGHPITVQDILVEIEQSPLPYKEMLEMNAKEVVDEYINQILLFQEAKRYERKLKKDVESIMRNYYIKTLTKAYVDKILAKRIEPTEEEIKEYYNTHLEEFLIPERVRIFEIVLPTQEAAEKVKKRLALGESFEMIATNESISESRKKAGDLGWIDIRKMDPEIASLVSKMEPGDILGNIIRTEKGYHILKLAGKMESRMLTLEEATPGIKELLVSFKKKEEVKRLISQLKERSRIRVNEKRIEKLKSVRGGL